MLALSRRPVRQYPDSGDWRSPTRHRSRTAHVVVPVPRLAAFPHRSARPGLRSAAPARFRPGGVRRTLPPPVRPGSRPRRRAGACLGRDDPEPGFATARGQLNNSRAAATRSCPDGRNKVPATLCLIPRWQRCLAPTRASFQARTYLGNADYFVGFSYKYAERAALLPFSDIFSIVLLSLIYEITSPGNG